MYTRFVLVPGLSKSNVLPPQVWLISGGTVHEQQPFIIQEWIGKTVSTAQERQADSLQKP